MRGILLALVLVAVLPRSESFPSITIPIRRHAMGVPTSHHGSATASSRTLLSSGRAPDHDAPEDDEDKNDDDDLLTIAELVQEYQDADIHGLGDTEDDWVPDRVKAQRQRESRRIKVDRVTEEKKKKKEEKSFHTQATPTVKRKSKRQPTTVNDENDDETVPWPENRPSPYTDEQEELIASMGGKRRQANLRESGYLGDSTLEEIARDYSVPVCYLADVLCTWGVPVPINVKDRLGDLVTGEQAFAILEAVTSLDVAVLQDRYANENLIQLCDYWEMDLMEVFQFCMKEGWSLPFGVRTCLRVEQVTELLRVMEKAW